MPCMVASAMCQVVLQNPMVRLIEISQGVSLVGCRSWFLASHIILHRLNLRRPRRVRLIASIALVELLACAFKKSGM